MSTEKMHSISDDIDKQVVSFINRKSQIKKRDVKKSDTSVTMKYTFEPYDIDKLGSFVNNLYNKVSKYSDKGYLWEHEVGNDGNNKIVVKLRIKNKK